MSDVAEGQGGVSVPSMVSATYKHKLWYCHYYGAGLDHEVISRSPASTLLAKRSSEYTFPDDVVAYQVSAYQALSDLQGIA